ncbi:MAG: GtrA family protein [Candidatus Peribacteraceae bacterium]|jgi:putative flippase GtrA
MPIRRAIAFARAHKPLILQFTRYLFSGGLAAFIDLSTYVILVQLGVDKFIASPAGNITGLLSAFFLHKFLVFREKRMAPKQFARYMILQAWNGIAQIAVIWLVVDVMGEDKTVAKILGIGLTVSWNFFLYKFLVYI